MSDETSAAIIKAGRARATGHRESYLRSGGAQGHIMDLTMVGGYPFTAHCLIKTRGRKSAKTYITPLIYGSIGGEVVLVGSKGGADSHPAWYLNIISSEQIEFQVATQAFRAGWREPRGAEREKIWHFMIDVFPPYARYQTSTARQIPLIMLKAIETVDVFKESDVSV